MTGNDKDNEGLAQRRWFEPITTTNQALDFSGQEGVPDRVGPGIETHSETAELSSDVLPHRAACRVSVASVGLPAPNETKGTDAAASLAQNHKADGGPSTANKAPPTPSKSIEFVKESSGRCSEELDGEIVTVVRARDKPQHKRVAAQQSVNMRPTKKRGKMEASSAAVVKSVSEEQENETSACKPAMLLQPSGYKYIGYTTAPSAKVDPISLMQSRAYARMVLAACKPGKQNPKPVDHIKPTTASNLKASWLKRSSSDLFNSRFSAVCT